MSRELDRPNILLIMSDQHHKGIMGCAGNQLVQTPALDDLAERGVRFENTYCPFPLCGPSRMSFMTCRNPSDIRCFTNSAQLSSDIPTFAHGFFNAGYETVLSGRMHFVGPDQRHGFEKRLIGDVSPTAYIKGGWRLEEVLGTLIDTPGMARSGLIKSGAGHTGYHAYDEAVTDATIQWLKDRGRIQREGQDARPFMLVTGFVSPHCPFIAPPEDYHPIREQISPKDLPDPHLDLLHPIHRKMRRACGIEELPDPEIQCNVFAAYYGLTAFMDRQIGRVLEALHSAGLEEDTLVVYCSDHGEALGEHGLWWKYTFYEGSVGVPLIVSDPSIERTGRSVAEPVSLMDLGVTLLDRVGANPLPAVAGKSFLPLMAGDSSDWQHDVFAENATLGATPQVHRMLRRGPWKYNYYHGREDQLFNLDEDPLEICDLAGVPEHAAIRKEMLESILCDWEPERILQSLSVVQKEDPLVRKWIREMSFPEPDPVWFKGPLANEIIKG